MKKEKQEEQNTSKEVKAAKEMLNKIVRKGKKY